jgi:succinyl-CoA synthetase alpha subunit
VVAGKEAVAGRIMGHAGAFAGLGEVSADVKEKALSDAGVEIVQHPSQFGEVMLRLLRQSGGRLGLSEKSLPVSPKPSATDSQQRRGYHTTSGRRPIPSATRQTLRQQQKRSLHLHDKQAKQILNDHNIPITDSIDSQERGHYLAITIDRTTRGPAIIASPTTEPSRIFQQAKIYNYDYATGPSKSTIQSIMRDLQLSAAPPLAMASATNILNTLITVFQSHEAYALETHLIPTSSGDLAVSHAKFSFDDSAFKSAGRQEAVHALRDISAADADELSVESAGIVYIKLPSPSAYCGTLINGAGLAMNAIDVLTAQGVLPTNFLDTGGKAKADTIKKSFEVILKDSRVRVIFVNIFGGLTDCGMIAEGVKLAFEELSMDCPVVVRLRGTNEEEGRRLIEESGLKLHAFDDFYEAVEMCRVLGRREA